MEKNFCTSFKTLLQQFRESTKHVKASTEEEEGTNKEKIRALRHAEDLVTTQGVRVVKLQKLKQVAIENEDYMTAKHIKNEIINIENAVITIDGQTGRIPDDLMQKLQYIKTLKPDFPPEQSLQQPQGAEQVMQDLH